MVKVGDKCRRTKDRGAYKSTASAGDMRGYTFVVDRLSAHGVYDTAGVFHGVGAFEVIKPDLTTAIAEAEALLAELKQQELEERVKIVQPGAKFKFTQTTTYEIIAVDGAHCWWRTGPNDNQNGVAKRATFVRPNYKLITD